MRIFPSSHDPLPPARPVLRGFLFLGLLAVLACGKSEEDADPVRPVRSMIVEESPAGDWLLLSGRLRARDEVNLAFRLAGKMTERPVQVGEKVRAGQRIARMDGQTERNARDAAAADLAAARAVFEQAEAGERRLAGLVRENAVSHSDYEAALRQRKTASAQLAAARARLSSAEEQLGYTDLKTEAAGVITAKGAEPGEVVRAGQMIVTLARHTGRDAVFDMPSPAIRDGLDAGKAVEVWLADDPKVTVIGHVREISPDADPATRTHQVKVTLDQPSPAMVLGSTLVGRLAGPGGPRIAVPASALAMMNGKPAVWLVEGENSAVHRQPVAIARFDQQTVVIGDGLRPGQRIVTAGAQTLHDGQKVRLLEDGR